jgi:deoxycytidylate deaminase
MDRPEIVIGLVGALGTDLDRVFDALTHAIAVVNYTTDDKPIRLSELIAGAPSTSPSILVNAPYEAYLGSRMTAGDTWRRSTQRGDAVALLAVGKIREMRAEREASDIPISNHAFILRSLKHADEVETLRAIYGPAFFLLSAYSPRQKRIEDLTRKITDAHHTSQTSEYEGLAIDLINRDEAESGDKYGQQVRETFWRGDAFVDVGNIARLEQSIQRIIQMWFGYPFHTPTRDEYLMFSAQAAAYRSASLGRQVGAVIATKEGSIVATGANEVPKAGGGSYWCDDDDDTRDHILGRDSSDEMRRELLGDIVQRLMKANWLAENSRNQSIPELVSRLLYGENAIMKGAEFTNLTEYQRAVHAEMTALMDAARRGISVEGCTLHSTTFPCHGCAKHIVAAGLKRVVYIEPYAKSLAKHLHNDAIQVEDSPGSSHRVQFEPFVGLAPRRYLEFFEMPKRKEKDGTASKWTPQTALPRLNGWSHAMTVSSEQVALAQLDEKLTVRANEGEAK